MAFLLSILLLLVCSGIRPAVNQPSEPSSNCYDWGESTSDSVSLLEGESGCLSCPLFSHPSVYNYDSQSSGSNLIWYRLLLSEDIEQPVKYSARLTKDRERLWLQPARLEDTGLYICMLRNQSSSSKISMRLRVARVDDVIRNSECEPPVAAATLQVPIPLQGGRILNCPDADYAVKMAAGGKVNVTWIHVTQEHSQCKKAPFWNSDREQKGLSLQFHIMYTLYQGIYFCTVNYKRKGSVGKDRTLNASLSFTRSINVTAVSATPLPKQPTILNPARDQVYTVEQGVEVRLTCTGLFPYLETGTWDIWWTVDGKTLDKLPDSHRFSKTQRLIKESYGDRTEENVLIIQDFHSSDLSRTFNCTVRNSNGTHTQQAFLKEEVSYPLVELGCGLGVTLVLMLLLFVLYHVFWLEILLLYRAWFGTDERHTDDKEYDVYISYARQSEEEQFVLSTLRSVLENELGYSVCIFDRDSLPGGTITDDTLSFVSRSRRLLVVVSPGYAERGSQALLELQAGIDGMARGKHTLILVQYRPNVGRKTWVRELKRARLALVLVQWRGEKSRDLTSHFWKRLRVELPVRKPSNRQNNCDYNRNDNGDELLMRMTSQNSTNSQTGLITDTVKEPHNVFKCAA